MNKQESYDFDRTHQYSMNVLDTMWRFLIALWNQKGKPQTKEQFLEDPVIKSIWVRYSGIIQRCNEILAGKNLDG